MINRDKLFIWFINNEPDIYNNMCETNHNIDNFNINVFHAEGQIISHTLLVMTWIEANKYNYSDSDYVVLLTSALLHDIGKPKCIQEMPANETKPRRNSFQGHEGVSTFLAIGVLKKLKNDFPDIYSDEIIQKIVKVVSLHGTYVEETSDINFLRCEFHKADKNGAVRSVNEEIFSQYSPRRFIKSKKYNENKELTVLIGLPCSGKTTKRNEILNKNPDTVVISRDDLLEEFYKMKTGTVQNYNTMYNYIHSDDEILKEFKKIFNEELMRASDYDDVLIDMTQLSLKSRRRILNNFLEFRKKAIVIMTDNETLFKRNIKRYCEKDKYISGEIIFNMMTTFTFPVLEEGFESIEFIIN